MGQMGDDGRKLSFLEKAIRLIPGYKGYKNKEERRDNDQLLRLMLVDRLDAVRGRINAILAALRGPGALDSVTDIDRLLKRLEKVTDEIRFADRGYSGWFDVHKVREEELDKLYEFDVALAENVASVEEAAKALATAADLGGPIKSQVDGMIDLLLRFSEKMTSRSDLMIDLEKNRPVD